MITRKKYMDAPKEEGWTIHQAYFGEVLKDSGVKADLTDKELAEIKQELENGNIHLNQMNPFP